MKRAASLVSGPAAGWLLLAAGGFFLWLCAPSPAQAQGGPPKQPQATRAARPGSPPQVVERRDPFRSLLVRPEETIEGQPLPPGKRGLVIAQLTLNGLVASPTERIAVVTMSGRNRAYFLRVRDELFNGYVSQITQDAVIFRERTKDPFGKQYEREVVRQLSGSGAKR